MNRYLLPSALLVLAAPLQASDARLDSRMYDPDEVVRIDGRVGVQAAIIFAEDELIENVAIGDSASWQVTPNKRATMLFVKPLAVSARTNMTVVTDKRSYYFDLVAPARAQPLYVLRFKHPDEPKRDPSQETADAGLTPDEELALGAASNPSASQAPIDPASLNFDWASKGKRQLLPQRVYDDGESRYLSWESGRSIPAILVRDTAGTEGPVNFAVRDDVLIVEGVPRLLVLRSGRDLATLENRGAPRPRRARAAPEVPATPIDPTLASVVARATPVQPEN